jgi:branched-chain amino acid transport system substrate-binding protein
VGGYDGMALIVHVVQQLKGKIDGDKAIEAAKSFKFNSPRGPISIDPDTRDIVMNEYLSEVYKDKDGKLRQKVIATIPGVKDACKAQKIPPCK